MHFSNIYSASKYLLKKKNTPRPTTSYKLQGITRVVYWSKIDWLHIDSRVPSDMNTKSYCSVVIEGDMGICGVEVLVFF